MKRYLVYLLPAVMILTACNKSNDYEKVIHDPLLYSKTVKRLNDIVLENNFPPMIASRNYAYANIAAYEVIAAGDSNYISLAAQIKHLPVMPNLVKESWLIFLLPRLLHFAKLAMRLMTNLKRG